MFTQKLFFENFNLIFFDIDIYADDVTITFYIDRILNHSA